MFPSKKTTERKNPLDNHSSLYDNGMMDAGKKQRTSNNLTSEPAAMKKSKMSAVYDTST